MDYEKKYNEALERARKIHDEILNNELLGFPDQIREIFPELCESDDEKMMRVIGLALTDVPEGRFTSSGTTLKDCLAYLEKQKEQRPLFGIYWHKIKKGEKLPCRAYLWNLDYEKHYDCFEGRLIANLENISVGGDTWYLPADDVRNLPREGVDELPREQKPAITSKFNVGDKIYYKGDSYNRYVIKEVCEDYYINGFGQRMDMSYTDSNFELLNHLDDAPLVAPSKPAEWSDEDEKVYEKALDALYYKDCNEKDDVVFALKDLCDLISEKRKVIHHYANWKPSERMLNALKWAKCEFHPDCPETIEQLNYLYTELKKIYYDGN